MREHIMNLTPSPMQMIKDGKKTIELRLYDEKRKLISVGDTIKFINTEDSNDTLCVTVIDLFVFTSSYAHLYLYSLCFITKTFLKKPLVFNSVISSGF